MNRILGFLALAAVVVPAIGAEKTISDITWSYTIENNEVRIDGAILAEDGIDLTIPAAIDEYPVASIGSSAFAGCRGIKSVTIPSSVTSIEVCAFGDCSGLTSVVIPPSITNIENEAFVFCTGLLSIVIPPSVKYIGRNAFYGCSELKTVEIPEILLCRFKDIFGTGSGVVNINGSPASTVLRHMFCHYPMVFGKTGEPLKKDNGDHYFDVDWFDFDTAPAGMGDGEYVGCETDLPGFSISSDRKDLKESPQDSQSWYGANEKYHPFVYTPTQAGTFHAAFIFRWDDGVVETSRVEFVISPATAATVSAITYGNLRGATHTNTNAYEEGTALSFTNPVGGPLGYTFAGWTPSGITADMTGDQQVIANWSANSYSIIYHANGGEGAMGSTPMTYDVVGSVASNVFVKSGCRFVGWSDSAEGDVIYGDGAVVSNLVSQNHGSYDLWAQWETIPVPCKIWFRTGGYVAEIDPTYRDKGDVFGVLPTPAARFGYEFLGWFTTPTGGDPVSSGTRVLANIILIAQWAQLPQQEVVLEKSITGGAALTVGSRWVTSDIVNRFGSDRERLFYEKFGSNFAEALSSKTGKRDGAGNELRVWHDYVAGTDPTDTNSVFAAKVRFEDGRPVIEWDPNLNSNGANRTYTIYGKENLGDLEWMTPTNAFSRFFKVSVAMPGGNVIMLSLGGGSCDADPLVVLPGDPIGTLPEPTRDGYLFDGWYTSEEGGDKVTAETIAVAGMTIYARWISATRASLMHRWSFNGDMSDSVGGVTAALKGTATLGTTTCSTLGGSSGSSYIDLGNDLLPTNGEPITVELWVKQDTSVYWARIFDFGSMPQEGVFTGSFAETYSDVRLCWNGFYAFGFPGTGVNSATDGYLDNSLSTGVEYYIVAIYAPSNTGVWQSTYRVRNAATGALVTEKTVTVNNTSWDSSKIGAKDCVLGQALTTWDSCAKATYNEVRIWKCALTDAEQQSNLQSGPDALAL